MKIWLLLLLTSYASATAPETPSNDCLPKEFRSLIGVAARPPVLDRSKYLDFANRERATQAIQWADTHLFTKLPRPAYKLRFMRLARDNHLKDRIQGRRKAFEENFFDAEYLILNRPLTQGREFIPDLEDVMMTHEYTHAVFGEYLRRYSKSWDAWFSQQKARFADTAPQFEDWIHATYDIDGAIEAVKSLKIRASDSTRWEQLRSKRKELQRLWEMYSEQINNERDRLNQKFPRSPAPSIWQTSGPYQEFVADLAGGLAAHSLERYREMFKNPQLSGVATYPMYGRSFIDETPLEGWNQKMRFASDPLLKNYTLFYPARSFLYLNYLAKPSIRARLPEFMSRVMNAITDEAVWLDQNHIDPFANPEAMNRHLMDSLAQALKGLE